jgi:hypothetical protein
MYQREVHKKLQEAREPITPRVAPPKIMRCSTSYKGDGNELFMMRYTTSGR